MRHLLKEGDVYTKMIMGDEITTGDDRPVADTISVLRVIIDGRPTYPETNDGGQDLLLQSLTDG